MRLHEKLDYLWIAAIVGLLDKQKEQLILLRRLVVAKADTERGSGVPAP